MTAWPAGDNRQVSLYNLAGSVDLVADVTGFYTPDFGSVFVPRNPERVLDTRTGTTTPVGPGQTIMLDLAGTVPLTTTGVVLNVTAVMLGDSLGLQLYNHAGSVHLVADLAGQFVAPEVACAAYCVRAWGLNGFRKLGAAEGRFRSPSPTPALLAGVRAIAGSGGNGYAVRADGTVWAWGWGYQGRLGNGLDCLSCYARAGAEPPWTRPRSRASARAATRCSPTAASTRGVTTTTARSAMRGCPATRRHRCR